MSVKTSRRQFLQTTALLSCAASVGGVHVHAGESSVLKIGLIGCGGRGCGAVSDAMTIDPNTKLVAAADLFRERGEPAIEGLKQKFGSRVTVDKNSFFDGFEGYKNVLKSDIDVVILATPQLFRPYTLRDAIAANKHVFCEKPVAVDGVGLRMVMAACEEARKKKLNIVSGLVNRYYTSIQDIVKRIHDGAIGDVLCTRAQRMGSNGIWKRPRLEGDTEMQYQMRNWVNFNWIASEYINDVTIHQIDVALWCMGDVTPVAGIGMGGRLARRELDTGDMYDSMATTYEFEDGRFLQSYSRQIPGAWSDNTSYIYGSKGRAVIRDDGRLLQLIGKGIDYKPIKWQIRAYQYEHKVLLDAIRSGGEVYVNNGNYMANSTGTCLLGKLAAYTGKRVTWDEMLAYEEGKPKSWTWDAVPPTLPNEKGMYKIAIPNEGWGYLN